MIYQSQNMRLKVIRLIARNEVNEIQVCENLNDSAHGLYTVIVLKDHEITKKFIEMNEKSEEVVESVVIDCFSENGQYLVVYPHKKERPIELFYMASALTLSQAEEACINLIIACMTSNLPWPVLYLLMTQKQVNISRDNSVYLSYYMDLSQLNEEITERDCVVECAKLMVRMLAPKVRRRRRANSYILLQKKIEKRAYDRFRDLYKDLKLAAVQEKKKGVGLRIRLWFERNRDTLFRIILVISIILAVFVVLTFLTNLIFGDVPWLRIFIRSFETIGLESLLQ